MIKGSFKLWQTRLFKGAFALLLALMVVVTNMPVQAEAASKSVKVSTQKKLEKVLSEEEYTKVTISIKKAATFVIPEGNYKKITLVISAPKATVVNNGVFKKVNVKKVKNYTDNTSGSTQNKTDNVSESAALINKNKMPKYVWASASANSIYPGQTERITAGFDIASHGWSGVTFKVSDTSIATIDDYGYITGKKQGKVTVTVTTANGLKDSCTVEVKKPAELEYKKKKDGSGYIITGCKDTSAKVINIPATYKNLPVVEIDGKAFIDCEDLRRFTVDSKQKTFYEQDGVLFTDNPVKTLVRFPTGYGEGIDEREYGAYTVPEDTVAIGDYAFAGLNSLECLHIPEGVTTMGDYVFTEVRREVGVFIPNSLTSIGKNILQDQLSNLPFYGSWDSYAAEYAEKYNIPFGKDFDRDEPAKTTAETVKPAYKSAASYKGPSAKNIIDIYSEYSRCDFVFPEAFPERFDLTETQKTAGTKEIRLHCENTWAAIIPDKNGRKQSEYPSATGVYGLGYTDEPATLIGYNADNKPIGLLEVSGNFIYSFPGAMYIAVSGGKGMLIDAFPYEPVFITSAGDVKTENLYISPSGQGFMYFVMAMEGATFKISAPDCLNNCSYSYNIYENYDDTTSGYSSFTLKYHDNTTLERFANCYIAFDCADIILENDELVCYANHSFGLDETDGGHAYSIIKEVKKAMVGTYYPKTSNINKITLEINGRFSSTNDDSSIQMWSYDHDKDEYGYASDVNTLAHEAVHAVDFGIDEIIIAPNAWFEGRAEYIEKLVIAKLGYSDSTYPETNDWSYLSRADKADFFRYYYFSTNRQTPYEVGYYFLKYINERFGENISAKIMKNIDKVNVSHELIYSTWSEEQKAEVFKKCVTDATCETVFDDFVKDVIEATGQ